VIAWEPWRWGGGITQPGYALDRIVAGDMDGYLRGWASGIAAWGRPVTLRFAHEMNGNWYPWAEGINGNGPGDYVAAWRHVHDLFKAAGAVNVTWMWAPNVPYPGSTPLTSLYPGRDYVDVVGLDGYNWGTAASWSSWTDPKSLFGPGLAQLRALAPGKPIVIAETASAEAGGSKPEWIKTLIAYLAAQRDIVGFVWFQFVKETDWRFDSTPASGAAFKQALANRR
jgi:beta-mannanase